MNREAHYTAFRRDSSYKPFIGGKNNAFGTDVTACKIASPSSLSSYLR